MLVLPSIQKCGKVVKMTEISNRLLNVNGQIAAAETKFDREAGSEKLLALSKRKPAQAVLAAYNAGQSAFGENHLQEAVEKIRALGDAEIEWHFIGPIQSNKSRPITQHFDWAHSIDRYKVAKRLNEQRETQKAPLNVCIQVNVSAETTKSGVTLDQVPVLAESIANMPNLRLRGLMAIPSPEDNFNAQRAPFKRLKEALDSLTDAGHNVDTLSMGMTNDMEAAIAEGSTMVRIGTAIFGSRE